MHSCTHQNGVTGVSVTYKDSWRDQVLLVTQFMARLDLGDPSCTAKCGFLLLRKGTYRLFLWDGMEEAEEEPCRRKHNLIICLCPEGKSSPGQLQSPSFALHQTKLCDPGESKHVVLTPADLCGTPQIIHKQRRNHTSLRGRLWVTVSEEILTDAFYLFYSNSGLFQLLRCTKWGIFLHNKIISSDIKITIKIEIKNFKLEWLQCIHM